MRPMSPGPEKAPEESEEARREEVIIQRRNGEQFSVALRPRGSSPFDVEPVKTKATTQDILEAIRESRERG